MLVNTNSKLPQIRSYSGKTPLESALGRFTVGQKEIVEYLYSVTRDEEPNPFVGNEGATLLCRAIVANFYNLALCLVNRFPELVMVKSSAYGMCGLELLVRRPFAFRSGAKMTWWQDRIYSVPSIKKLYKKKLMHVQATSLLEQMLLEIDIGNDSLEIRSFFNNNSNIIKVAIKHGLVEFVVGLLWHFSYLSFNRLPHQRMIEMAIEERNETILNLTCDCAERRGNKTNLVSRTDSDNNTILHYASKQAPPAQLNMISGVALQMQRELQWFQGVERMMSECDRWQRNKNGDTAQFIFQVEHKDLLKKGEDWMKDTSGSCMIVAALIAAVAFAAAFTVPGGNISDTNSTKNGTPVFLRENSFTAFVVADALALFASITSALMFLAIYTSRYAEIDFLRSLPQKLIIGLSALFISMAAILVAFGASLYIVVGDRFAQATIPIALFSCCPMVLFTWLQLPLFYEMVRSTYWVSVLRKHRYIST
ncbi:ankyrin repeat-containing protein NPR4-like [Papaver somniferum]|uniref:ankyrin repeat-containing protein NPR4-like n=1 Tax=Papaver somniferum TaxID=3469 RepID=UPI000E6F6BC6|nr:ankyrin repeat-containing protein NPR4-like [Papaver somniferum]